MIAARFYTQNEFERQLVLRGCEKILDESGGEGSYWRSAKGRKFQVPPPEEPDGKYPDWMLDHIILVHLLAE